MAENSNSCIIVAVVALLIIGIGIWWYMRNCKKKKGGHHVVHPKRKFPAFAPKQGPSTPPIAPVIGPVHAPGMERYADSFVEEIPVEPQYGLSLNAYADYSKDNNPWFGSKNFPTSEAYWVGAY